MEPPWKQPHSTTTPSTSGGISSSFAAIARCAWYDVPVTTFLVVRYMRHASRTLPRECHVVRLMEARASQQEIRGTGIVAVVHALAIRTGIIAFLLQRRGRVAPSGAETPGPPPSSCGRAVGTSASAPAATAGAANQPPSCSSSLRCARRPSSAQGTHLSRPRPPQSSADRRRPGSGRAEALRLGGPRSYLAE